MSQAHLASKIGAHWVTVSKLERGKQKLTQEWIERISSALFVEPFQVIESGSGSESVINGFIDKAGAFSCVDMDDDILEQIAMRSHSKTDDYVGTEIKCLLRENDFYPILRKGDFIRFYFGPGINPKICENRLTMVLHRDSILYADIGFARFDDSGTHVTVDRPANEPLYLSSYVALGAATRAEFTTDSSAKLITRGLLKAPPKPA